jgi:hypothetical protein
MRQCAESKRRVKVIFVCSYHSDLYQGANGAIRQPFPDIPMCLSMVWYMTDVDENSGGTYCVPGAHRDTRNPRGPTDGITVTAPIPGDMQITAPAGSVFIQDSRCDPTSLSPSTECVVVTVPAHVAPGCGTAQPATTYQASCALLVKTVGFRGGSMRFVDPHLKIRPIATSAGRSLTVCPGQRLRETT